MRSITTILVFLIVTAISATGLAQSYAFGFKGGPSLNRQSWSGLSDRALLLSYFGDIFIETAGSRDYAFGASLGYHNRGSVHKFSSSDLDDFFSNSVRYPSRLGNLSLLAYLKQYNAIEESHNRYYYFVGGRLDYNVVKDLGYYQNLNSAVENFTYGITAGGGFDWYFGELWGGFVEFSVAPDFSKQLYIPKGYIDINGFPTLADEKAVFNLSIELAVGLRLMHIITYIEE